MQVQIEHSIQNSQSFFAIIHNNNNISPLYNKNNSNEKEINGHCGYFRVTGYFLWVEVALSQYSEYSEHEEGNIIDASQVCPKDFNL